MLKGKSFDTLIELKSLSLISDLPDLPDLNDLVAVGHRQFYVTNNPSPQDKFSLLWRSITGEGNSKILFYDSKGYKIVDGDLALANGIAVSKDLQKLYVADSLNGDLLSFSWAGEYFKRDPKKLSVSSSLDNLEWKTEEKKALLIGAHPSIFRFGLHAEIGSFPSPSQVLQVEIPDIQFSDNLKIQEVFYDNGSMLSGSSVAALYGKKLLLGSATQHKLFVCELGV